jgi:hypothetical protein
MTWSFSVARRDFAQDGQLLGQQRKEAVDRAAAVADRTKKIGSLSTLADWESAGIETTKWAVGQKVSAVDKIQNGQDMVKTAVELKRQYDAIDERAKKEGFTNFDRLGAKAILVIEGALAFASNKLGFGGNGEDVARDAGEGSLKLISNLVSSRADAVVEGKDER